MAGAASSKLSDDASGGDTWEDAQEAWGMEQKQAAGAAAGEEEEEAEEGEAEEEEDDGGFGELLQGALHAAGGPAQLPTLQSYEATNPAAAWSVLPTAVRWPAW
ncbi:hypothetical protein CHLRE_12g541252v5 [Chlamydomonas reinhardtii]|uniref:Uncharacterized protein n=1 Tax=Chlamydomonas reinhardtii TaxID=3055 RepID=A0A2K3D6W4_CHLRE|nr:uncharacterized protein CHLRE_12g541252v5 [Chlamydomonas reinhardtii]PNW76270.1 hypothetical protein CHLRE_12g541252v5 [Chlamydomonas reinhardtii]